MEPITYIFAALVLGIVPPLFWLWFWLKEDANPEPRGEIAVVFLAGMGGVIVAILLENSVFSANNSLRQFWGYGSGAFQLINVLGFAFIEEIVKVAAAFFTALKSKYFDEPVDAMVYMVVAALGFAALENVLFVADSLRGGLYQSITVTSFRFVNAILLHIAASALVGAGFAFTFFHKERRVFELVLGVFLATLLHSLYNFFIINGVWNPATELWSTVLVVLGAGTALLLFERARKIIV